MLRLRPPPPPRNNVSSRRDHNNHVFSTRDHNDKILTQKVKPSTQLQLKSPRRGVTQQQIMIDAHHVTANTNTSIIRKPPRQSERRKDESTTQQYDKHRQRCILMHNHNTEPSSHDSLPRRRRKVSSYHSINNTQSLFVALIRLVVVSALTYFILVNVLSIIYNIISAFVSGVLLPTSRRNKLITHLDNIFVQNIEEIRQVLELAKTEFDIIESRSKSSNQSQLLHSVRGEETIGYFEQITHPGDKSVKVSVPKFYASVSMGENGSVRMFRQLTSGKLLTRELAGMIGGDPTTTAGTDPNNNAATSDRTIFVSIISKSDSRCSNTVSNVLRSAANPERIRVAVVFRINPLSKRYAPCDAPPIPCTSDPDQILCMYNANVDVYELNSELDAGAMFARHIGQRMYRGEYYALQVGVDAGIVFSDGWDEELIRQWEATNNEMAVITTYLSETRIRDGNRPINATPKRYTICHATYEGDGRERRLEHTRSDQVEQTAPPDRTQTPMLQPFWSSELSFSRGHFVLQVPYDPQLCGLDEQDEEVSMALRAFSSGYDFYTPTQSAIFRTKVESSSQTDGGVGLCKANAKNKSRKRLYSLIGLDNIIDEDTIPHEYGLGAVRDTAKFFTLYGIHASEQVTEHRLCEFVTTGNMHDEFVPHIRRDGMGIDYNRISFRFHELISIHKDNHQ